MQLLDIKIRERKCAGIMSENIRENLVYLLLDIAKPDLLILDEQKLNSFHHSANLAKRDGVDDYLIKQKEAFDLI